MEGENFVQVGILFAHFRVSTGAFVALAVFALSPVTVFANCQAGVDAIDAQIRELKTAAKNMGRDREEACRENYGGKEPVKGDRTVCRRTFDRAMQNLQTVRREYENSCERITRQIAQQVQRCQGNGASSCMSGAGQNAGNAATEMQTLMGKVQSAIAEVDRLRQENLRPVQRFTQEIEQALQNCASPPCRHNTHGRIDQGNLDEARKVASGISGNTISTKAGSQTYSDSNPVNDHGIAAGAARDTVEALRVVERDLQAKSQQLRQLANENNRNAENTNSMQPQQQPQQQAGGGMPQMPQIPQQPQSGGDPSGLGSGISNGSSKNLSESNALAKSPGSAAPGTKKNSELAAKLADSPRGGFLGTVSRFSQSRGNGARLNAAARAGARTPASVDSSGSSKLGGGAPVEEKNAGTKSLTNPLEDGVFGPGGGGFDSDGAGNMDIASTQGEEMLSDLQKEFGVGGEETGLSPLDLASRTEGDIQAAALGSPDTSLFDRVHSYHKRCQQKGCVVQTIRLWEGF